MRVATRDRVRDYFEVVAEICESAPLELALAHSWLHFAPEQAKVQPAR